MTKPGFLSYLIGNPVSALIITLGAMYLTYQAAMGAASWVVAIIAIIVALWAGKAYERVEKYRLWKLEWDAMGGQVRAPGVPNIPGLRLGLGLVAWALGAFGVLSLAGQPGMEIPVFLFWLATGLMVVVAIYRLFKRSGKRKARDVTVSWCLPAARNANEAQQAYGQLPDYCHALFRAQSAARDAAP